jgi:beta-glucanase (GH16 family)
VTNYKLIWSDDFNYVGKPDPNKWVFDIGGHGGGNLEAQFYTDNSRNCFVEDGKLTITAIKEQIENKEYTSSKIHTFGKFSFQYGRVAVKAKLPRGKGTWPAIWLLADSIHDDKPWPLCGELDVMEHVGRDPYNIVLTLHSQSYNHRLKSQQTITLKVDNCFDEFVEYAMNWKKDSVEYFIDDISVAKFKRNGIKDENTEIGWPFDQPFHLLINLAIGGTWGGEIDDSIFPVKYEIEYVRIYEIIEE